MDSIHTKLNIEANHATLMHTFSMIESVQNQQRLGSIDANQVMLGWDTDQFPTNLYDTTLAMRSDKMGGFTKGGLNFDAKVRRASFEPVDCLWSYCRYGRFRKRL